MISIKLSIEKYFFIIIFITHKYRHSDVRSALRGKSFRRQSKLKSIHNIQLLLILDVQNMTYNSVASVINIFFQFLVPIHVHGHAIQFLGTVFVT